MTQDDFQIKIFRIPHGKGPKPEAPGPPVLLSHGVLDAAGSWVTNLPHQSLAYLLADAGYDVWLGNVRGTKYSQRKRHTPHLPLTDWAFSFDLQARYDVPDTINHILDHSRYDKVAIVGHSQGCTQTFAAFSHYPTLKDKVSLFCALAPAGYFAHNRSVLMRRASRLHVPEVLKAFGVKKFLPMRDKDLRRTCLTFAVAPKEAEHLLGLLMGSNPGELNPHRFGVMCHNFLGMTSVQNMIHWAQLVRTKKFRQYNYHTGNLLKHHHLHPPVYDIRGTYPPEVPIAVWYGTADLLVSKEDAEALIADLPAPPVFQKNIPEYCHLDFHLGTTAHSKIYVDVIRLLREHAPIVPPEDQ